jgi:hypothetical protein
MSVSSRPLRYTKLTDVVAISICDFELWPDAEQDEQHLEQHTHAQPLEHDGDQIARNHGLLQVQYAFLELPKLHRSLPQSKPATDIVLGVAVHARAGADRDAGSISERLSGCAGAANKATCKQELGAYQKVKDEIEQVRELAETSKKAESRGRPWALPEGAPSGGKTEGKDQKGKE